MTGTNMSDKLYLAFGGMPFNFKDSLTLETARQLSEFLGFPNVVSHEIASKKTAKNEQSKASFAPKEDYFQEKLTEEKVIFTKR